MDGYLTFKKRHIRWRKKARAAEAKLRTFTTTYGAVPESIRAIQVECVQAVALYGSKLWWDPQEIGRRGNLQLLLNRQASTILGMELMTPTGALKRDSGLPPTPVILDSRQQRSAVRLTNACSSNLVQLHKDPLSGAPLCQEVDNEDKHSWTTEAVSWPAPGEEQVVRTIILDDKAQPREPRNAGQQRRKRKSGWESKCGRQLDHLLATAEWMQQQCTTTVMNGAPAAVISVLDIGKSLMLRGGRLDSLSGRQSRKYKDSNSMD
jgi:hypothetical protein